MNDICISIVSHGQANLINHLLQDLHKFSPNVDIIITSNICENLKINRSFFPHAVYIENTSPKGYGANHNAAFKFCRSKFFCVLNPDIRISQNPFSDLVDLFSNLKVGIVVPKITNTYGETEDSVRFFPTFFGLFLKFAKISKGIYPITIKKPYFVDWAAGMFLLFRSDAFSSVNGFDEKFFLYYEDVDICARLWKHGWKIMAHPGVSVVHNAQRTSRQRLDYLIWHLTSMFRYFYKYFFRSPR